MQPQLPGQLSLQVFERVLRDAGLTGYDGLGLAVQTYQRRASDVFGYLERLARDVGRRIPVRLVKVAYWDTIGRRDLPKSLKCSELGVATLFDTLGGFC